jgi:ATP-dependent Clp protease ATP-binding subunit ClpA
VSSLRRLKKAKVVTKQHEGIELPDKSIKMFDGASPDVSYAAQPCRLDRSRRPIEANHIRLSFLEGEGDAARAASHVEHLASHRSKRLALSSGPITRRGEIDLGTRATLSETVFAFDDLGHRAAPRPVEERTSKDVAHDAESSW